ncbi:SRPBCC domain-containing protein [Shimazuella kribbensis]|uniref:SRPBCC domain-containing protein n=1 Tax=Shimazuella kribbensis TaxID=139808 RepID=UPI0003F4CDE8|nr:SRPBCC domain-containing protein [Shimazuella kribbensis]
MATNTSKIRINAPKEKVWSALTKPELVKEWQYGSDLITDWQVGSDIRFRNEWEGTIFEQWGKVLEVEPFDRLSYNLFAPRPDLEDRPENYFIMNYILTEKDDYTLLTIEQLDNRPETDLQESDDNESPILTALKNLVETN